MLRNIQQHSLERRMNKLDNLEKVIEYVGSGLIKALNLKFRALIILKTNQSAKNESTKEFRKSNRIY